jgi:hypothetical protein
MVFNSQEIFWLDEWTINNGIIKPAKIARSYNFDPNSNNEIRILRLDQFIPPKRSYGIKFFDEKRLRSIFDAFEKQKVLPPVKCITKESDKFALTDGFHRFYASNWYEYSHIPAILDSWFVFEV